MKLFPYLWILTISDTISQATTYTVTAFNDNLDAIDGQLSLRKAVIAGNNNPGNEIRSIFGLPLQAGTIDGPTSPVWLPAIPMEAALASGFQKYLAKYGCAKP